MKLTLPFPPSVNSYWRAPSKGPLKGRHLVSETGRKFQQAARAAIIEQLRAVPRPSSDLAEVHINVVEGAGLELDPDDDSQVLKAIGGGRLLNIVTFTKSGTYTPTKGTKRVRVKVWGAGGGGQNAPVSVGASGGCAGGFSEGLFNISDNETISVTIGTGGSAVAAGVSSKGGNGGDTRFGSLISATGGSGGGATVPAGSIGSGGNILNITGGISQGGLYYGSDAFIGGAGGSAFSSTGGNGHFGSSGDDGGFPGSGGAGGNGNYSSGKGANGLVYLEEFS